MIYYEIAASRTLVPHETKLSYFRHPSSEHRFAIVSLINKKNTMGRTWISRDQEESLPTSQTMLSDQ